MEIEFKDENTISFDKELSVLDKLAISAFPVIHSSTNYVIISGYVAILFGRSRVSEDIDAFVEKIDFEKFSALAKDLENKGFWFVNSSSMKELFGMLKDGLAVRIAEHGKAVPNIEIKFPSEELDFLTLENPYRVILNGKELLVSRIEQQIAYKFYLGTEKDMEDAIYLYELFKEHLDRESLKKFGRQLNVMERMKKQGVMNE